MKFSFQLGSGLLIIAIFAFNELPINSYAITKNNEVNPSFRGLQSSNNGSPKLMTKPCTVIRTDDMWQCAIDPEDAPDGGEGTTLTIDGYYIPDIAIDSHGEPIVSGQSTMFSPRVMIDDSRIFVPPSANPIFENPSLVSRNEINDRNSNETVVPIVSHNCVTPSNTIVTYLIYSGKEKNKPCAEVGKGLCQRDGANGGKVYHVCTQQCAEYDSLRELPDFPACGKIYSWIGRPAP